MFSLVAQICNLPYRRFAIGKACESSGAPALAHGPQNAILRYSRLQICATLKTCYGGEGVAWIAASPLCVKSTLLIAGLLLFGHTARAQTQKFASQYPATAYEVPFRVREIPHPQTWVGEEPGPVPGLKVFAREKSGAIWLGGAQGAARYESKATHRWDRWQYFYGRRWLPDNEVGNIWVDESRATRKVWIRSRSFLMTLG